VPYGVYRDALDRSSIMRIAVDHPGDEGEYSNHDKHNWRIGDASCDLTMSVSLEVFSGEGSKVHLQAVIGRLLGAAMKPMIKATYAMATAAMYLLQPRRVHSFLPSISNAPFSQKR